MSTLPDPLMQLETTCNTLLYELQLIWDEVGESDAIRDKMLLELEQECLEVYRRKVDQANRSRAQLRQAIADAEAELAAICSTMGERPVHIRQADQVESLNEELRIIFPQIEEMQKRKLDRRNQFLEVLEQIQNISNEICRSSEYISSETLVDENDLSLRKLEELHRELYALQKEKSDRLKQVQDHLNVINSVCLVLGVDFKHTVSEVHPSLGDSEGSKNISDDTINQLVALVKKTRQVKIQRMQRLQDLATTMLELWNLMDTPIEEQQVFQKVTCNVAASEHEVTEPNTLSEGFINHVEAEVARLEALKTSRMKELVLKKRSELEEMCQKTHIVPEANSAMKYLIEAMESGDVDSACVLEQIELHIAKVKEEAFSRKEILEKIEKWLAACEEECWLEEYNMDQNRYNAGKGAHLILKRAEKARSLVSKLPAMVEALASKTMAWEKEREIDFIYDGTPLLSMLEEYTISRQEKEQERRRQRDQKKLQGHFIAEQEVLYGSKSSPSKPLSVKKAPGMSTGGASSKKSSLAGTMPQTPRAGGGRGLDAAGVPIKRHGPGNTCEEETPMMRRPFSPISTASSKSNTANVLHDQNITHSETVQRAPPTNKLSLTTPSKTTSVVDEENKTPKAIPVAMPATPSTVSVPMQTAVTPAPTLAHEEIEYSFEERRLGFMPPQTCIKPMIQV